MGLSSQIEQSYLRLSVPVPFFFVLPAPLMLWSKPVACVAGTELHILQPSVSEEKAGIVYPSVRYCFPSS